MTRRIAFTVMGQPVAKQSFRAGNGHGYQPKRVVDWENAVAWCAAAAMTGLPPFDGPVRAELDFYLETHRRADCDNLVKAVNDGAQAGGLLTDDKWIMDLRIRKHYCERGRGRVEIVMEALE